MTEAIRDYLHFDPFSGVFYWLKRPSPTAKLGVPVGLKHSDKYARIMFRGKNHLAHRLGWWIVHGSVPKVLDHINGDTSDNSIANLRPSSAVENGLNQRRHRAGKLPYAGWKEANGKWQARYKAKGRDVYVGLFETESEAHRAALEQMRERRGN